MKPAIAPVINDISPSRESTKAAQILQGAMQEFLAKGYAAASMDRVAAAAGVSKATIYSHFGDKETLFKYLVETMAQEHLRTIVGQLDQQLAPRAAMRQLITASMNNCCDNPEFQEFKRMLIGVSGQFPELAKTFIQHLAKPGIETLTEYFEESAAFNFPDPEATARIVIGAMVHFGLEQKILHGAEIIPMAPDRLIDAIEYLLFPA
ncbi:MAG: hypothetical protein RLZZ511_2634 [Cyanobacteriota bacterium]|jgi:TetR/AcrR family transcriptional regulator, regulator of autoinduction and epiphytic fitness